MTTLARILRDPRTEHVVLGLIIFNAITLGLETSPTIVEPLRRRPLRARPRRPRGFRDRARGAYHRLPRGFLPRSVEPVRLVRGRHRARAVDRRFLGPAGAARPARAAPDHGGALAPTGGGRPDHGPARHGLDPAPAASHLLRVLGHGREALRSEPSGAVRQSRHRRLHALPGHDLRRLVRRHRQAAHSPSIPMRRCSSSSSSCSRPSWC